MNAPKKHYVICIDNTDYESSLIPRKLYEVLPDERAEQDGFIRVIDESGEDYLYNRRHFIEIELPPEVEEILASV